MSFGYSLKKNDSFHKTIKNAFTNNDGTSAYQIFMKSPQRKALCKINKKDKDITRQYIESNNIDLFVHSGYLFNIGDELKKYPISTGVDDMINGHSIGAKGVVFHVGKHCKRCTVDECINRMVVYINLIIEKTLDIPIKFILETGAGCGTEVCRTLHDLKYIYDNIKHKEKFGFCIDTCHIYASGFDIKNKPYEYIEQFDEIIGLDTVCLIHLNDSKGAFKSCKDRHQNLGKGEIGEYGLSIFVTYFYSINVPIVLETPTGFARQFDLIYIRDWIK
tara:strand:- start:2140 stop:2967 length:828 start_codon:yes stop_codon:yes gene_type:complete